jgi:hypothetical protein
MLRIASVCSSSTATGRPVATSNRRSVWSLSGAGDPAGGSPEALIT